jgi:hypothetical protein
MPQVASNILAIVNDAKLPLRAEDAALLERYRRIHHEDIPIRDIESVQEIPVRGRSYTAPGSVNQKAEPTSATTVQTTWKPMGPPSAEEKRPPVVSPAARKSTPRLGDASASPSLETLRSGNWPPDSDSIPIRRLATDRLSRVERRRLQAKIRRQLDRAQMRLGDQQSGDPPASLTPDSRLVDDKPPPNPHGQKQLKKRTASKYGKSWVSRKAEFPNHVKGATRSTLDNAGDGGTLVSPNLRRGRIVDGLPLTHRRRRIKPLTGKARVAPRRLGHGVGATEAAKSATIAESL